MVKTTVLINTHNHAAYIAACIESVLNQTSAPDQILVYDDASTDGTVEIVARYSTKGVELLRGRPNALPPHASQMRAINALFARASGQLIFLLDGDDRFLPTKVAHYREVFSRNPDIALLQSPAERIDARDNVLGVQFRPERHIVNHIREIHRRKHVDFFYPSSTLAFSRYFLERVMPLAIEPEIPIWSDMQLTAIAPYFGRILTLDTPLTQWRRHPGANTIRNRSRRQLIELSALRARAFNRFSKKYGFRTIRSWLSLRYLSLWMRSLRRAPRRLSPFRPHSEVTAAEDNSML